MTRSGVASWPTRQTTLGAASATQGKRSPLHDPGGSGFLGFGLAYQQRFTVHLEVHYGG